MLPNDTNQTKDQRVLRLKQSLSHSGTTAFHKLAYETAYEMIDEAFPPKHASRTTNLTEITGIIESYVNQSPAPAEKTALYMEMCDFLILMYEYNWWKDIKSNLLAEKMIKLDPDHAYANLLTAELYLFQKRYTEAITLAANYLRLRPTVKDWDDIEKYLRAKIVLMTVCQMQKNVDQVFAHAAEAFKAGCDTNSTSEATSEFYVILAWAHLQRKQYEEARKHAGRSGFSLSASLIFAEVNIANDMYESAADNAEYYLTEAKSRKINNKDNFHYVHACNIFLVAVFNGSQKKAREVAEELLTIDPESENRYANLLVAELRVAQSRFEEARVCINKVVLEGKATTYREMDIFVRAKTVSASIDRAEGRVDGILDAAQFLIDARCMSSPPNSANSYSCRFFAVLAWAHLQKRNFTEALTWAQAAQWFIEQPLLLAEIHFANNQFGEAAKYADKAVNKAKENKETGPDHPDYVRAFNILFVTNQEVNRHRARGMANEMLALMPNDLDANLFVSEQNFTQGQYDDAIKLADKVLSDTPKDSDVTKNDDRIVRAKIILAKCNRAQNRLDEAVRLAEEIQADKNARSSDARKLVAWLYIHKQEYEKVIESRNQFFNYDFEGYALLAEAHFAMHQPAEAFEYATAFLASSNASSDPLYAKMCHILLSAHLENLTACLKEGNEEKVKALAGMFTNPNTMFARELTEFNYGRVDQPLVADKASSAGACRK